MRRYVCWSGAIVRILEHLDPAIDVVVSGHTHRSYICDYSKRNPAKPFLLTSAGQYGTLVTDINLTIDPSTHKVVSKSATPDLIKWLESNYALIDEDNKKEVERYTKITD